MSVDATGQEFQPSVEFAVPTDGHRNVVLTAIGDSFISGQGDPKGQGWFTRVVGRMHQPNLTLTPYNLGVRGNSSADIVDRWRHECEPRWREDSERRLVVSVGLHDVFANVSLARHRLNLANILDDARRAGISTFMVSPPPIADESTNTEIAVVVEAQADVCSRRAVPYVDCFGPLRGHDQWRSEMAAGDGIHPGSTGYGLMAWLVLHGGWGQWLNLPDADRVK